MGIGASEGREGRWQIWWTIFSGMTCLYDKFPDVHTACDVLDHMNHKSKSKATFQFFGI